MENHKFILTDDSCSQYVMQINNDFFICIQYDEIFEKDRYYIVRLQEINLNDYSQKEINDYITGYYSSIKEIKNTYRDEMNQIIAECIFEQQTQDMADYCSIKKTEKEAEKEIQKLIHLWEGIYEQK